MASWTPDRLQTNLMCQPVRALQPCVCSHSVRERPLHPWNTTGVLCGIIERQTVETHVNNRVASPWTKRMVHNSTKAAAAAERSWKQNAAIDGRAVPIRKQLTRSTFATLAMGHPSGAGIQNASYSYETVLFMTLFMQLPATNIMLCKSLFVCYWLMQQVRPSLYL